MKQKEYSIPKPLCYFAIVLIGSSIFGLGLLYSIFNDISFDSDFSIFIIAMIMFHLIVVAFPRIFVSPTGIVGRDVGLFILDSFIK